MSKRAAVVLLLEDEPLIAMDLELTLGSAGFLVTTLMSCGEAKSWLAKQKPDIAIVDIELRDGPSHEVVQHLIEHGIPFIVHSGDQPSMRADTPFVHGHWMGKPANPVKLVEVSRALLA